jgi:hypothetical protein
MFASRFGVDCNKLGHARVRDIKVTDSMNRILSGDQRERFLNRGRPFNRSLRSRLSLAYPYAQILASGRNSGELTTSMSCTRDARLDCPGQSNMVCLTLGI